VNRIASSLRDVACHIDANSGTAACAPALLAGQVASHANVSTSTDQQVPEAGPLRKTRLSLLVADLRARAGPMVTPPQTRQEEYGVIVNVWELEMGVGGPPGDRTRDALIKSQVLYH